MSINNILKLKTLTDVSKLFSITSYSVSVIYIIYDSKKKRIVHSGTSRACGDNIHKTSIHAEELAIRYCINKKKNYKIIIYRYNKKQEIKKKYCCLNCTKLAKRYNYERNIYTIDENNELISAIEDNPVLSLGDYIKYKNN